MRLISGYEEPSARREMIALMDCIFLLLVFFVYAMLSMVVHRGIRVDLPFAATADADRKDHVTISIDRDNRIYVDRRPVAEGQIVPAVQAARAGRQDVAVVVSGDRRSDLGTAVRVLDLLRAGGIREVSFQCREGPP